VFLHNLVAYKFNGAYALPSFISTAWNFPIRV